MRSLVRMEKHLNKKLGKITKYVNFTSSLVVIILASWVLPYLCLFTWRDINFTYYIGVKTPVPVYLIGVD